MFSMVYIRYGFHVLIDWTYTVLESRRMDREGSTEINLENRATHNNSPERKERGAKLWGNLRKFREDTEKEERTGASRIDPQLRDIREPALGTFLRDAG